MGNTSDTARKIRAFPALKSAAAGLIMLVGMAGAAWPACLAPDRLTITNVDRMFIQQRVLPGLHAPLISKGRVEVEGEKIIWHMTDPFDVRTVITPDGLSQSIDGGPSGPIMPGVVDGTAMMQPLSAIMRADWDGLEEIFQITRSTGETGAPWHVILIPRSDLLRKTIGSISIMGCREVTDVNIVRGDGDQQMIRFISPGKLDENKGDGP